MYHKELEEILKKKFESERVELDQDALWEKVYPEIKKDKKRPLWIWFSGVGILLLGFTFGWLYTTTNDDKGQLAKTVLEHAKNVEVVSNASLKASESVSLDLSELDTEVKSPVSKVNKVVENHTSRSVEPVKEHGVLNSTNSEDQSSSLFSNNLTESSTENSLVSKVINRPPLVEKPIVLDLISLAHLGFLKLLPLQFQREMIDMSMPMDILKKEEDSFSKIFSIEVLAGYGKTQRFLKAQANGAMMDLDWRNANEKTLDGISFDLLATAQFSKNWKWRIGLDYQMVTDQTFHQFEKSDFAIADSVLLETREEKDGSIQDFYGEGEVQLITTYSQTKYNYFHSIGLPLEIAYMKTFGRLSAEVGAGIRMSKLFAVNGIMHTQSNDYDLDADPDNLFGRSLNLDLLADLGVSFSISDHLRWMTRIQYQHGLNGVNTLSNPIEQKYNLLKIKTGLTYQF